MFEYALRCWRCTALGSESNDQMVNIVAVAMWGDA
jgi:hypothetical protein